MRLFLASKYLGGLGSFLPASPAELNTLFVPTAGSGYPCAPWIDVERAWFTRNGFETQDLELATASSRDVRTALTKTDFVYVAGGNTYFLLRHMQRTEFWEAFRDTTPLYAGASAGAIVTCPDVAYIDDLDERAQAPELVDTSGAGLVDFRIMPHMDYPKVQPKIDRILAQWPDAWPLVKLNDDEALVIQDHDYEKVASPNADLRIEQEADGT